MKKLIFITSLFIFALGYQGYAQQDVHKSNAPKLLPMEKVENPKNADKSTGKPSTVTKTNAPTLDALGTTTNQKPKETVPADKVTTPTLSNANKSEITTPKKDKK